MIRVDRLAKTYRSAVAMDDASFTAAPGRVTGFLGPNGAGKSTTMRMMVGLTRPTSGTATISGRRFSELPNPGREVGVLLDASTQHAGRTGREILSLSRRVMGLPRERVDEMLATVGLTPIEARRRVRDCSLGMRQRLGIAAALLGDPETLLLDEPANGLDPAGIRWMRDLLRGHADNGGTGLLSSHLLHEIEVIADDIVVIGQGRIVARGSKTDLLAGAGTLVRTPSVGALSVALAGAAITVTRPRDGSDGLRVDADPEQVGRLALQVGIPLVELRATSRSGAWRRCSWSSPPAPNGKEQQHEHRGTPGDVRRQHLSPRARRRAHLRPADAQRFRRAPQVGGHAGGSVAPGRHRHRCWPPVSGLAPPRRQRVRSGVAARRVPLPTCPHRQILDDLKESP